MVLPEARGVWNELERRLRPYVARRVASQADVDDVVQDVLIRVHHSIDELRDAECFGSWVYRIAQHAIHDLGRARAKSPLSRAADLAAELPAEADADEVEQLRTELVECAALFVALLPSPYREAITLTELEGLSQKDAATMLGISLSGVKSRVQRGRHKLREMFEQCCYISVDARGRVLACEPRPTSEIPEGRAPRHSEPVSEPTSTTMASFSTRAWRCSSWRRPAASNSR